MRPSTFIWLRHHFSTLSRLQNKLCNAWLNLYAGRELQVCIWKFDESKTSLICERRKGNGRGRAGSQVSPGKLGASCAKAPPSWTKLIKQSYGKFNIYKLIKIGTVKTLWDEIFGTECNRGGKERKPMRVSLFIG